MLFDKDLTSTGAQVYNNVAKLVDSISFAITSEQALFDELNIKSDEAVVLFKKFDEGRNDFDGTFQEEEIKSLFTRTNSL